MKERNQTGEVIATSYSSFTVESYELNNTPPLGGLVIAENVIGVVCSARTEGLGPISAKGSLGDEDGGVYQLYPDLQRTLRTNFTALVVGCYADEEGRDAVYTYPECPPRVHYKCWLAGDDELVRFTDRPDYLRLLLFSTEADPASSSGRWDKEVTSTMPNAVHVTVSGVGHPTDNKCLRAIRHALFRSGTTKNLDTNCVAKLQRPPFKLRTH